MTTYAVNVTCDGPHWLIHVPQFERDIEARFLGEIEELVRELISATTYEPPSSFDLAVRIEMRGRDYLAGDETNYLMRSPANARRLLASIEDARSGAATEHELIDPDAE